MNSFIKIRNSLKDFLLSHYNLAVETQTDKLIIDETIENLKHGEMSIAVVGEVNRGKSTFLNALLGTTLFPSRASVCTAGVTVLDYGEKPEAKIIYNNGKTKSFDLDTENPSKTLVDVVSRTNDKVRDIKQVKINYPNQFTGNGLVLVDTPGVNDPDTWREDITYEYLSGADAIIMLLDPMQPLSESEREFLEHKILGISIANLIFVVNKIDDDSITDRAVAMGRIENILKKYVPNPMIYPVASKPALKAKKTGDKQALNITGFPEFEAGLLDFLSKGRGGLLLRSKIQKGLDHLSNDIQLTIEKRVQALDSEKSVVQKKLEQAEISLKTKNNEKDDLQKDIKSKGKYITQELKNAIAEREQYLNNSLKPALLEEPSVAVLRANILSFQRDCVEVLQTGIESTYGSLFNEYGDKSSSIMSGIQDVLSSLSNEASSSVQSLEVNREKVKVDQSINNKKTGAAVGGALGAGAGMAIAGSATTIGLTAAGTLGTVAAFGTLATIGIGILTGGLGLLVGAGIAAVLSEKKSSATHDQSSYVHYDEMVNNRRALLAVDRFLNKLKTNINRLSDMLVDSLLMEIVKPLDQQIKSQNNLIKQISDDLNKTDEDQQSIRDFLASKTKDANGLHSQYSGLMKSIEDWVNV
jgi:predicted GTPase/predicted  nucleic acid-binding Zn-ribbon protein